MTENIKYIETSIGLIPSDWKVEKLGSLGKLNGGGTPSTSNLSFWSGNIPWISSSDLDESSIYEIKENRFITDEAIEKSATKLIPKNSILIVSRVGVGKVAINTKNICTSQDFTNLTLKEDNYHYFAYLIKLKINKLLEFNQGTSIKGFVKSDLEALLLPVPPIPEQLKIASILSTWDVAIDNCKAIIEELKVRNKGLTQKLFNKEFEKKHLSEIFERVTTKNSEKNQNVITISAQRGFIKQTDFFNKIIASDILDHYTLVKKGDFCYNKSYSNGYDWGATKRLNDFEKAVVTTLYICFRLKDENQNSEDFFEYYFESGILYKGLSKVANEGGRAHGLLNVTSSDFFNIKIGVPTFEEQKAIANILDKATQELKQYEQKLETLQLQKKGLMQQLLTGKTRVKI